MKDKFLLFCIDMKTRLAGEEGQDLIEYALLVGLIALAATASLSTLASDINGIFVNIGTKLASAT
jgi:pilus assembly protein Flp/PilA